MNSTITRIVEITTNIGCSISCSYCPQYKIVNNYKLKCGKNYKRILSYDNFKYFISQIPTSVDIHFSGFSEPFHNSDCTQMIMHAHNKGHKISVFTTTDGLTVSDLHKISSIPFKRFCIHLPDNDNILRLNIDDNYINLLKSIITLDINNLDLITIGDMNVNILNSVSHIRHLITGKIHSRAGNNNFSNNTIKQAFTISQIGNRTTGKSIICRRNRMYANVLLPNGDLQLCCMDYGLEEKIGNLFELNYSQIVNGKLFHNIINRMSIEDSTLLCRRCEYAKLGRYIKLV